MSLILVVRQPGNVQAFDNKWQDGQLIEITTVKAVALECEIAMAEKEYVFVHVTGLNEEPRIKGSVKISKVTELGDNSFRVQFTDWKNYPYRSDRINQGIYFYKKVINGHPEGY
jgi:hypothetical protein